MNEGISGFPGKQDAELVLRARGPAGAVVAGTAAWQAVYVPTNAKWVEVFAVGAGSAGGAGFTRATGVAGGGGGGGACGGTVRARFRADFLPKVLWAAVPVGGVGGAGAGGVGGRLYLSMRTNPRAGITGESIILVTGSTDATGGGAGTGTIVGAAGAASTVASLGINGYAAAAMYWQPLAGSAAGSAGGAVAGAAGVNVPINSPWTGGAGGAGTTSADFAGGSILSGGQYPVVAGGLAGSNNGSNGYEFDRPNLFTGGAGGGSSNTGVGGTGGTAHIGSGGGGGGAGTTGGFGGNGGDGRLWVWFS